MLSLCACLLLLMLGPLDALRGNSLSQLIVLLLLLQLGVALFRSCFYWRSQPFVVLLLLRRLDVALLLLLLEVALLGSCCCWRSQLWVVLLLLRRVDVALLLVLLGASHL